ncbi:MAG: tRNA pseudouridine(38-40) synthase TruA [Clostridiaceae bacterium]|nr:tRNA pseudouridine(38-40) synthase TruA [Clostridiaceae bacterium]
MRNIMIKIEYDGTNYNGWQFQPNGVTVQEEIMKALKKLTKEEITINGSGRTDAGVHAKGQVANFYTNSKIPEKKIAVAINHFLPDDISILEAKEVPMEFHARYWAKGKTYTYQIYNGKQRSALLRNYSYHITYKLDMDKIKKAIGYLIGTYDFRGFMTSGSSVKNTVRTIHDISIHEYQNSITFTFEGNGFLYNMVRIIIGTLVEIGGGRREPEDMKKILQSKDRNMAGHTAPPQGLFLNKVVYPLDTLGRLYYNKEVCLCKNDPQAPDLYAYKTVTKINE